MSFELHPSEEPPEHSKTAKHKVQPEIKFPSPVIFVLPSQAKYIEKRIEIEVEKELDKRLSGN